MKNVVVLVIGRTGDGKSSFLNAYLQKEEFEISSKPESCTFLTSSATNIVNNMERICIDTQGLEDVETLDAEHVQQMTKFLLEWNKGVNAIAIVLNGQYDRLSAGTIQLIKMMHQLFNHKDFFDHVCLVFTKWFKDEMTEEDKFTKRNDYRNKIIEVIKQCPGCENSSPQIPVYFVNSKKWKTDPDTANNFTAFHSFAMSRDSLPTKQVQKVDTDYMKKIPEIQKHVLLKTKDSKDGMVRTLYYADRKRYKQISYNGVVSYSDWENFNETTETKKKKIKIDEQKRYLVNESSKDVTRVEGCGGGTGQKIVKGAVGTGIGMAVAGPVGGLVGGVASLFGGGGGGSRVVHDHFLVTKKYVDKQRMVITDFDGNVHYGDWKITNSYTETTKE